jgi:hypothetical protein
MTWVAAPDQGTELEGFGYGARVEFDLADGTTLHGRIVVPGTDRIGSVHKIDVDTDPAGSISRAVAVPFTRPEFGTAADTYAALVGPLMARRTAAGSGLPHPCPGRCPECGEHVMVMDDSDRADHVLARDEVVVGCEGYWIIDPALVGIERGWTPLA